MNRARTSFATKVVGNLGGNRQVVVVGVIRERLFGIDTIEEAMKVVDKLSSKSNASTSTQVLLGINDQEFNLIKKSLSSRNSLKGRFMSPVMAMCHSYSIPVSYVGRNITTTSGRLSNVFLRHPAELYKVLWIIFSKSLSVLRTPQARPFVYQRVPHFVNEYLLEGSRTMTFKLLQQIRLNDYETTVAVIPMENFHDVTSFFDRSDVASLGSEEILQTIATLDEEASGVWIPVIILYIIFPCTALFLASSCLLSAELGEMKNFKTEGFSIVGSWVRDVRRD